MVADLPCLTPGEIVFSAKSLRLLGADGLTALLRLRPELLAPFQPSSLQDLAERACSPEYYSLAIRRWDLPTIQIVNALAALGEHADRPALLALLGLTDSDGGTARTDSAARAASANSDAGPAPAIAVLERSLATLDVYGVLVGGGDPRAPRPAPPCRLDPEFAAMWPNRLGLDEPVRAYAETHTVDDLKIVLRHLGLAQVQRKADLVRDIVTALTDPDRVRALAADAPPELAGRLLDAAHGRTRLAYYGSAYALRHVTGAGGRRADVLDWALQRFLLVRTSWSHMLEMPAEVALALRGPGWTAPFTPDPAPCPWVPAAPVEIARAAQAAASGALRELGAVLTDAGARPLATLKNGGIGVRELRRLAGTVRCTVAEVRLHLALAHRLGLLAAAETGLAPTDRFDAWQALPAPQRYAHLVRAWLTLPSTPIATEAAWSAEDDETSVTIRRAVLTLFSEHPDATPAGLLDLTRRLIWRAPEIIGMSLPGDTDLDDLDDLGTDTGALNAALAVVDDPAAARSLVASQALVAAVLAEAGRLGVLGAGALSPAGTAALAGNDIAAAAGELGSARSTARLQSDLTAVVPGEPDPRLAAVLDRTAVREHLSAAAVWRFSPASIRRALDAGDDPEDLIDQLRTIADGGVPQPLEYLVRDVARRHGRLRGGAAGCYLRSDDEPLLAEIVADRKLTKLKLRRVAPTVVVSPRSLPDVISALRAAGQAPVTEGPDGEIIVERRQRHRVVDQDGHPGLSVVGKDRVTSPPDPQDPFGPRRPVDPAAVAAQLLARPDATPDPYGIVLRLRDPDTGEPIW